MEYEISIEVYGPDGQIDQLHFFGALLADVISDAKHALGNVLSNQDYE